MILWIILLIFAINSIESSPLHYQYVNFLHSAPHNFDVFPPKPLESSFNWETSTNPIQLWNNEIFNSHPTINIENGHFTPDFSNGLEYPDPLLLTGAQARRAVSILYNKELFFENIPHVRALLRKQEERKLNGLSGNRLGSLQERSPFYRYKKNNFRFF